MENKRTSDMYLAGAIKGINAELLEIDKVNQKRQEWVFKNAPIKVWILEDGKVSEVEYMDLEQVEMAFRCGKLMIPAEAYANGLRSVKNMLYDN